MSVITWKGSAQLRYGSVDTVYQPIQKNGVIVQVDTYKQTGKKTDPVTGAVTHSEQYKTTFGIDAIVNVLWLNEGLCPAKIVEFVLVKNGPGRFGTNLMARVQSMQGTKPIKNLPIQQVFIECLQTID